MSKIHPSALVDENAKIAEGAEIGPFSIIGSEVEIGEGTTIGPYVQIKGRVIIGKNNQIFHGCCIGEGGQDLTFNNPEARIEIGDENVLREHVIIHQPAKVGNVTKMGNQNYLMCQVHLGHDVQMGNNNVLTPSVMVGGHVVIEDNAYLGGLSAVHQHVRIGKFAIIGGVCAVLKDVPPYTMYAAEGAGISGLNKVGLQRANYSAESMSLIKKIYKTLFMRGMRTEEAIEKLQEELKETHPEGAPGHELLSHYIDFLQATKRGLSPRL